MIINIFLGVVISVSSFALFFEKLSIYAVILGYRLSLFIFFILILYTLSFLISSKVVRSNNISVRV